MRLDGCRRKSFAQRSERTQLARGDPGATVFRDHLCGTPEVFGLEQVLHRLLPGRALQKIFGKARVFSRDPRHAGLGPETAAQETLEEWMQTVFFARPISG